MQCAQHELSEEMNLTGGNFIPLLKNDSEGISELKWGVNTFFPFLCIDPQEDLNPMKRDDEEYIIVHNNVTLTELKLLILEGKLCMPAVQTTIMALNRLYNMELIDSVW